MAAGKRLRLSGFISYPVCWGLVCSWSREFGSPASSYYCVCADMFILCDPTISLHTRQLTGTWLSFHFLPLPLTLLNSAVLISSLETAIGWQKLYPWSLGEVSLHVWIDKSTGKLGSVCVFVCVWKWRVCEAGNRIFNRAGLALCTFHLPRRFHPLMFSLG